MIEKDLYASIVKASVTFLIVIASAMFLFVTELFAMFGVLMMLAIIVDQGITSFNTVRECVKEIRERGEL